MKHITIAIGIRLLALVLAGVFIATPQAQANAPIMVNSTADEVDVTPGDGQCVSTPSGQCTLRAAIIEANALTGTDTIDLPAGIYTLTIAGKNEDAGATGDLDIYSNLVLNGSDSSTVVVDGNQLDRVFHVTTNTVTVTISGLTIQNGNPGFLLGGGILNSGRLLISNSLVTRNMNSGISNGATLVLADSQVVSNTVAGLYNVGSSAIVDFSIIANNSGAGLYTTGVLTISDSVVTGNTTQGIYNSIVSTINRLTLIRSTVVSNTASSNGGGIYNSGTLSVISSSVLSNTSSGDGGGIYVFTLSRTTLVNSTVSGNRADGNGGGLVFAYGGYAPPDLYNVTLTNNVADNNND